MRLIKMKVVSDTDSPENNGSVYNFLKIETSEERRSYNKMENEGQNRVIVSTAYLDWVALLKVRVGVDDDAIFYYFMENDRVPAVGKTFKLDNIIFRRIK